jgi:glycosyltransferase involved in cell wall biosynthesis
MFIVQFTGGLGNQIFQYNFAKFLSEQFPTARIVIETKSQYVYTNTHGKYELTIKQFRRYVLPKRHAYREVNDETYTGNYSPDENILFRGYWQDIRFFPKEKICFREVLGKIKLNKMNKFYLYEIFATDNSVSLHVRRGDYVEHFLHSGIATAAYFNNAVQYIEQRISSVCFFVFSDDLEWVKKNVNFGNSRVIYVAGNGTTNKQAYYDLFLMSQCKHNIISNSSFSFWAQQFNNNHDKIVITPPYWFNEKTIGLNSVTKLQKLPNMTSVPNIPLQVRKRDNPFFSIVLTAYNQEDYIRRALSSVLNQSFQNFELIVVDDGSTDSTPQVLREYAEQNCQVTVVTHAKNESQHKARISGVARTHAPYVVFLDGDDYFREGAFDTLYQKIKENPDYDFYEFGYIEQPRGRVRFYNDSFIDRFSAFFTERKTMATVWNKVYNAQILQTAFDDMENLYLNQAEDVYESIVIAYYAKHIMRMDCLITNYRTEIGISMTRKNIEETRECFMFVGKTLDCINNFLVKKGLKISCEELKLRFIEQIIEYYISCQEYANDRINLFNSLLEYFSPSFIVLYLNFMHEKNRMLHSVTRSKEYKIGKYLLSPYRRIKNTSLRRLLYYIYKISKKIMKPIFF